jgi:hypothetical protein
MNLFNIIDSVKDKFTSGKRSSKSSSSLDYSFITPTLLGTLHKVAGKYFITCFISLRKIK